MSSRNRIVAAFTGLLLPLATVGFAGVAEAQAPTASCEAALAGAPQYPPAAPGLQVDQNSVTAGGSVVASGCGTPSGTVTFTLRSRASVLGTTITNPTGLYRAAVAIPCEANQGADTLTASGAANGSAALNISGTSGACARVAATAGDALPRTGSSSTEPLVAAGIGLVLIGAATAVTARRRRRAQTA